MALDKTAGSLALRNRAIGVSIVTTGATSIAATATGFTRATGSFLTDGFVIGMELLASGFSTSANNGYKVVTGVAAGTLTVSSLTTMAIEAAGSRTLAVGLPGIRGWENITIEPKATRPFMEADFVPATKTLNGQRNGGLVTETGLYVLKYYGIAGVGEVAIRKLMDALEALYAPGTPMTAGSSTVYVRDDLAPWQGQIIHLPDGRPVVTLTVPWIAYTLNSIAA